MRRWGKTAILATLRDRLKGSNIWVAGSRDYRAFEDYLLPVEATECAGIGGEADPDRYVASRAADLHERLNGLAARAARGELDGVEIEEGQLYIARTKPAIPDVARSLAERLEVLLPRVRITEVLSDVEGWTGFGDTVETAVIVDQWLALMRLKASIQAGGALRHPAQARRRRHRQRPVARLRALGRIERTLFTLQWLSDPDLRQCSHAGLNKGEIRDRTFENQIFRASGLSLITAAIVHWNIVYLDRAVEHLRAHGVDVPDDLLAHVAPLGWEHIALTGDYVWVNRNAGATFRPLRDV